MAIRGYATNPLNAGESLRDDNIILTLECDDTITKGIFVELVTVTAAFGLPILSRMMYVN